MELAEILALTRKVIFLVGGACVLILIYYRYIKADRKITSVGSDKDDGEKKNRGDVVNVRRCEFSSLDDESDSPGIRDVSETEREWLDRERSSLEEFLDEDTPQQRKTQMRKELMDLGYLVHQRDEKDETEENADPF